LPNLICQTSDIAFRKEIWLTESLARFSLSLARVFYPAIPSPHFDLFNSASNELTFPNRALNLDFSGLKCQNFG
jgi:hypothetical protein